MKEKPILFSGPMVNAILAGRKTQTRRIVKPQPSAGVRETPFHRSGIEDGHGYQIKWPYELGMKLWVRESWGLYDSSPSDGPDRATIFYRATDGDKHEMRYQLWRPSIFMPRWASRIQLEVTGVSIERLQAITPENAIAEGLSMTKATIGGKKRKVYGCPMWEDWQYRQSPVDAFQTLWDEINGKRACWEINPFVWAIEFKVLQPEKV
jgi:hypothetical protein